MTNTENLSSQWATIYKKFADTAYAACALPRPGSDLSDLRAKQLAARAAKDQFLAEHPEFIPAWRKGQQLDEEPGYTMYGNCQIWDRS